MSYIGKGNAARGALKTKQFWMYFFTTGWQGSRPSLELHPTKGDLVLLRSVLHMSICSSGQPAYWRQRFRSTVLNFPYSKSLKEVKYIIIKKEGGGRSEPDRGRWSPVTVTEGSRINGTGCLPHPQHTIPVQFENA